MRKENEAVTSRTVLLLSLRVGNSNGGISPRPPPPPYAPLPCRPSPAPTPIAADHVLSLRRPPADPESSPASWPPKNLRELPRGTSALLELASPNALTSNFVTAESPFFLFRKAGGGGYAPQDLSNSSSSWGFAEFSKPVFGFVVTNFLPIGNAVFFFPFVSFNFVGKALPRLTMICCIILV